MTDPQEHPEVRKFRRAVDEHRINAVSARNFRKFLDKQAEDSPVRQQGEEQWARHEQQQSSGGGAPSRPAESAYTRRDQSPRGGSRRGGGRGGPRGGGPRGGGGPPRATHRDAKSAEIFGEPFTNPYTFIPFSPRSPERRKPTPLSIDEIETERRTGYVDLEIEALSPVLTCAPEPVALRWRPKERRDPPPHRVYRVLSMGNDAIVPATGVRGALRSLLSVLTGGTLSYLDDNIWLTQGRDVQLTYRREDGSTGGTGGTVGQLARIVEAGSANGSGVIELGRTEFIRLDELDARLRTSRFRLDNYRSTSQRPRARLFTNDAATEFAEVSSDATPWEFKLSGRPVNRKFKREAYFRGSGQRIEVPRALWKAYLGRHRHAVANDLRKGDLVWLQHVEPGDRPVRSAEDIASIQWARWGRVGDSLRAVVDEHHAGVLPDALRDDGRVDEVTDLFGMVPSAASSGAARAFAARIRPENLVFEDALSAGIEKEVTLAPLAAPHPGCAAFYRDCDDLDRVSNSIEMPLRGYKVYGTSKKRGSEAPWLYRNQPIYKTAHDAVAAEGAANKTCDLVREGCRGRLRIAFRALSERELNLLLASLQVDWRLGGGKPLGLGHCRVVRWELFDELGARVERPDWEVPRGELPASLGQEYDELRHRMSLWQRSQQPVERLAYPSAASERSRGGHVWFSRHVQPIQGRDGSERARGLRMLRVTSSFEAELGAARIAAQALPRLESGDIERRLFGYGVFVQETKVGRNQEVKSIGGAPPRRDDQRQNHSQNRDTRRQERDRRRGDHGGS